MLAKNKIKRYLNVSACVFYVPERSTTNCGPGESQRLGREEPRGGLFLVTGRIAGTEGEDSESHDGVQGVAGDSARVLAISNEAHVAAFPPTGPPTEKIFVEKYIQGTAAEVAQSRVWCFSPDLFLMSQ